MHSVFGTNLAVIGPVGPRISGWINDASDGDFDIKVFEPGALAGGYAYYDPVSQGAFEAAFGYPGRQPGQELGLRLPVDLPVGPGALEFNDLVSTVVGVALRSRSSMPKDGIKYLLCGMIPPETSGWFRTPIKSLEELRALKMRFFGMGAKGHAEVRRCYAAACWRRHLPGSGAGHD